MVVVRKGSEKRLWVAKILLQVQLYFPQVREKSSVGKTVRGMPGEGKWDRVSSGKGSWRASVGL